jgi:Uma2 family endonuclease
MLTLYRRMTLEEYLDFTDGSELRSELVDGALREMGAESELNVLIGSFLFAIFLQFLPYYCIRRGTEIVVPGRENYDRDDVDKRAEYAARGILEYWIVDPQRDVVLVLKLEGDRYAETACTGRSRIPSPTFPTLSITATEVLNAGRQID